MAHSNSQAIRKKALSFSVLGVFLFSAFLLVIPSQTSAASKTVEFELTKNTTDNPLFNDSPTTTANFVDINITNNTVAATDSTTSQDSELNHIYTWRLSLTEPLCSAAKLESIRLSSMTSVGNAGDPDLAALMLYRADGSDQYNLGNYTVTSGFDYSIGTGFATPPNNIGIKGVVRGTADELGGVLPGALDATWDVSGLPLNSQFGIMIQQDSENDTTDLQTTVETAELTYDDSDCNPVAPTVTPNPRTPKTGDAVSIVVATAVAVSALFLIFHGAKKLKGKH